MLKSIIPVLGAVLLAASSFLHAQAPQGEGAKPKAEKSERRHERRMDCSQAPDPKACEARRAKASERREKMRAAHAKAQKACEGKAGDERRSCMRASFCADSADPAKCEARMKDRAEHRKQHSGDRKK